jgi:hypothetical protein
VRVADHFAHDGVAAVAVGIADANGERVLVDVFELVDEIAAFLVEEGFSVGDEKLHVANLGTVDGGGVNFVENAVGDGKPDFAGGGVSGRDSVFSARGPARFKAGRAKGRSVAINPAVTRDRVGHRVGRASITGFGERA